MEYFTERGESYKEVMARIETRFGRKYQILTHQPVRIGGFLGLFGKEGVEVTGVFTPESAEEQKRRDQMEKQKILNTLGAGNRETIMQVLDEVKELKQAFSQKGGTPEEEHENLSELRSLLEENDFTTPYIREILARARRELSLETLDDWDALLESTAQWIGESVEIHQGKKRGAKPRVMVLVGPTGVGKTTTIAKLAAIHGFGIAGNEPRKVRMITIDNYRIGAKFQIESYGTIMKFPVTAVENYQQLQREVESHTESDMIFVDTIGRSPRDFSNLAQMNELIAACGKNAEIHLAVSATTKTVDMREIMDLFEPFRYRGVILTKMDETRRVGNLISVLSEKKKPISYITDGQNVPQDISRATVEFFLKNLEGFPEENLPSKAVNGTGVPQK